MSVLFISYHNSRNTLFFFSRLAGSRLHPGVASGWAQFCSTAGTLRRRGSFQFSHRNYPQYIKAIAKLRRGRFWGMGIRGTLEEQRGGGGATYLWLPLSKWNWLPPATIPVAFAYFRRMVPYLHQYLLPLWNLLFPPEMVSNWLNPTGTSSISFPSPLTHFVSLYSLTYISFFASYNVSTFTYLSWDSNTLRYFPCRSFITLFKIRSRLPLTLYRWKWSIQEICW